MHIYSSMYSRTFSSVRSAGYIYQCHVKIQKDGSLSLSLSFSYSVYIYLYIRVHILYMLFTWHLYPPARADIEQQWWHRIFIIFVIFFSPLSTSTPRVCMYISIMIDFASDTINMVYARYVCTHHTLAQCWYI